MIGRGDNTASARPNRVTVTEHTVILPGKPSDNQLEFGIPVIRDDTFDRLHLEFTLGGNCSPGKTKGGPKASNSDTTSGLPESSANFIKVQSRSAHCPSALSQKKSDGLVQDKTHSVEATSDGSFMHTTSCASTATAESDDRMAEDSMDDRATVSTACPGLAECSTGFIAAAPMPIQTPPGVRQEKRPCSIQDDQSFISDPWPGRSSIKHPDTLLNEAGIAVHIISKTKNNKPLVAPGVSSKQLGPSNRTHLNAVNRSSVWYKNSRKERLTER